MARRKRVKPPRVTGSRPQPGSGSGTQPPRVVSSRPQPNTRGALMLGLHVWPAAVETVEVLSA